MAFLDLGGKVDFWPPKSTFWPLCHTGQCATSFLFFWLRGSQGIILTQIDDFEWVIIMHMNMFFFRGGEFFEKWYIFLKNESYRTVFDNLFFGRKYLSEIYPKTTKSPKFGWFSGYLFFPNFSHFLPPKPSFHESTHFFLFWGFFHGLSRFWAEIPRRDRSKFEGIRKKVDFLRKIRFANFLAKSEFLRFWGYNQQWRFWGADERLFWHFASKHLWEHFPTIILARLLP